MHSEEIINTILNKKLKCVFISPHFDDVALSCGALLLELTKHKVPITIVNVFTTAHEGPYTLSARKFLHTSGKNSDALTLFKKRRKEDEQALSSIKVKKIVNLNIEDALFRRKTKRSLIGKIIPEFDHIYPTFQWDVMKKIKPSDYAINQLKTELQKLSEKDQIIFAPYGIGGHVDHQITRKVVSEVFDNVILYSDFPYNIRTNNYGEQLEGKETYEILPHAIQKESLIKKYRTQFSGLFPNRKMPFHKEVYFIT